MRTDNTSFPIRESTTARRMKKSRSSWTSLVFGISLIISCLQNFVYLTTKEGILTSTSTSLYHSMGCHRNNSEWNVERESKGLVSSEPSQKSNFDRLDQRLVTVFSSGCSPSQDWQSQVLLYTHQQHNIPGDLIRLLSCNDANYTVPLQSYEKYRVVRTPDFNVGYKDDYSPRNRPGAMAYWLNGQSVDDPHPPIGHDRIVMAVDPDMIFLHSHHDILNHLVRGVQRGKGVASLYGIGSKWVQEKTEWRRFWCDESHTLINKKMNQTTNNHQPNVNCPIIPHPNTDTNQYSFGHPQILTAEDARKHAEVWFHVTNYMRRVHNRWETEMYSNVISMHRVNIHVQIHNLMVSSPDVTSAETDIWKSVQWHRHVPLPESKAPYLLMGHYCQQYRLGNFVFSKTRSPFLADLDLVRNCNQQQNPKSLLLPSIDGNTQDMIADYKTNHTLLHSPNNDWLTTLAGNGWMIDRVYRVIQEAIGAYYEEFCLVN